MEQLLKQFNFSEAEIAVYKVLLKSGGAKVSAIAKVAHLKRTSVHEYIRSLEEKGFINSAKIGSKYFYQADDPDKFRQIIDERQYIVDRLIPVLRELRPKEEWQAGSVTVVEAQRQIKRAKRKGQDVALFGSKDVGGALLDDQTTVLYSTNQEIPGIKITSRAIYELHKALLSKL